MNNTGNNNMRGTQEADLPPLPPTNVSGPAICANIRLYLAVWDDLSPFQRQVVSQHMQSCPDCSRELQLMKRSTHLVACLDTSEPSARVDEAVMAAIAARSSAQQAAKPLSLSARRQASSPRRSSRSMPRMVALGGIAAALLLAAFLSAYFVMGMGLPHQIAGIGIGQSQQAFALPTNLSWNNYVLYKQTVTSTQGNQYRVTSYHNMSDDSMRTETVMDDKVDVLVVKDQQKSLGLDLMNHVAQWNVHNWDVDDSMFDLATLQKDLQTGRAKYLGEDHFKGQDVYRIRNAQGDILLLNMQYMPINALNKGQETANSKPMFDQLQWLQPNQVPDATWDMKVPANFKIGKISAQL
ncbi:MAG: hypothetical protein H0U76_15255 [Ktedonobacteraceae bacterium]|nr:hypothetical protein [Ktedonobacteraceae bacterium]